MRSSPQFGCTLAAYELLQRLFLMPGAGKKETAVAAIQGKTGLRFSEQDRPLEFLRSRNALKIILVSLSVCGHPLPTTNKEQDMNQNFAKPKYLV